MEKIDYELEGVELSDWTQDLLNRCTEKLGRELTEEEIILAMDYAIGYAVAAIEDVADKQAAWDATVEACLNHMGA